ncbi:helix-turn-helix domain-containing protein [Rhodococcus sp. NPDC056960]|uniref:helix-turn-helix domain-containing protein n=1 Tax=Rhodococcus sp. NPDC056960 TaxID=3345982 RepID=UPI00362554CF
MAALYVSVKQLAERWDCNEMAVYRLVQSEKLPALRIGQAIRIPIAAVEQYEAENTTGTGKPRRPSEG